MALLYSLTLPLKYSLSSFIKSFFGTILNKSIVSNSTFLLLLSNITKVGTIKALANRAIFKITRAKAIEYIALRVISIRLFSPRAY
jgi:hypothetical protein